MKSLDAILKEDEPTPWCAGMVEGVLQAVYPLPKVDEALAQLSGATVFSKLDANSRFWQIPLAKKSRLLTTFITPFGRYSFKKLPFGILSAPEHFQKRMGRILEGVEGVLCQVDDVLVRRHLRRSTKDIKESRDVASERNPLFGGLESPSRSITW